MSVSNTASDYAKVSTKDYVLQFILFWILGLINNIGGVVVLAAAKSVSESFDKAHYIGAISWANTSLGLFAKMINVGYLLNVRTSVKMTVNAVIMLTGTVLTAMATKISFELCIVGILFIGISSALGESVLLGYFKHYQPRLVGSWSSGTGAAGLFGTGLYLLLKSVIKLNNFTIYMIMIPLSFIYYFSFVFLHNRYGPHTRGPLDDSDTFQSPLLEDNADSSDSNTPIDILQPMNPASHMTMKRTTFSFKGMHSIPSDQDGDATHNQGSSHTSTSSTSNPLLQRQASALQTTSQHQHVQFGGSLETPFLLDNGQDDDLAFGEDAIASSVHARRPDRHHTTSAQPGNQDHQASPATLVTNHEYSLNLTQANSPGGDHETTSDDEDQQQQHLLTVESETSDDDVKPDGFCAKARRVFPLVGSSGLQLMAVYFLEYVVIVGYASHANPKQDKQDWFHENAYEILSVMYQVGVFISRSSISILHIDRVEFLTVLQAINFTIWMFHALYHYINPIIIQFLCMIFVGLIAGAMYVNVFHNIQKNQTLGADKEFAINLVSICVNVGITLSSVFTLVADATFLKKK